MLPDLRYPSRRRPGFWPVIERRLEDINWKRKEDDDAERNVDPVAEPVYATTIPVGFGLQSWKAGLIWADGPALRTVNGKTGWFASVFYSHSFNAFQRAGVCLRIVADDIPLYDVRTGAIAVISPFTVDDGETEDSDVEHERIPASIIRFYDGIDNPFDPYIEEIDGEGEVGAFNGIRGIFIENLDLEPYDDRLPLNVTITWTDAPSTLTPAETYPLLGSSTNGYSQNANTKLCYDEVLNRFYAWYDRSDESFAEVHIGTTDFDAKREGSLAKLTDKPNVSINNIWGGCALPGDRKILCIADYISATDNWYLLVDTDTGKVAASYTEDIDEETEWQCALPLLGGASTVYIAGGFLTLTNGTVGMAAVFMAVDVTNNTLTKIVHGLSVGGASQDVVITPGKATADGTTFFLREGVTPGKVWKATFVGANSPPAMTLVFTTEAGWAISGIRYDASLDIFVISEDSGTAHRARAVSAETGTVVWTKDFPTGAAGQFEVVPQNAWYSNSFNQGVRLSFRLLPGFCVLDNTGGVTTKHILMDMRTGNYLSIGEFPSGGDTPGHHFDQYTGTLMRLGTDNWDAIGAQRHGAEDIILEDLLTTLLTYDGGGSQVPLLKASQIAFALTGASLDDTRPKGFGVDRDVDLRQSVLDICTLWGIERVDTATGVKFRNRLLTGLYSPDVTLTETDLRERDNGVLLSSRRRDETSSPREVVVNYRSADADYNVVPAKATRPTGVFELTQSLLTRQVDVPLFLRDGTAQILTNRTHKRWIGTDSEHEGVMRAKWLKVEPGDCASISVGNFTYTAQITQVTKREDHGLEFRAENFETADDQPAEAPDLIVPTPRPRPPATRHVFLDGPLLSPSHDLNGLGHVGYHVISGADGWPGGDVYMRRAGEAVWARVGTLAGVVPFIGVLTAALPAPLWTFETDTVNTLKIRPLTGATSLITSQTEAQYYDAASYALIGGPGRWLALTWRTRTINADGTISFTTLFQGLKGTEPYQGTSATGDFFVLIRADHWVKTPYLLTDLADSVQFKAVGRGQDPGSVPGTAFTISGAAEKPIAPWSHEAVINGSNIDISWQRSSRGYAPWPNNGDGSSGPLFADLDVYKLEIMETATGATVKRTYLDVAGQAKTYPAADIAADWGGIPATLHIRTSQKSSIAGIGYGHTSRWSFSLGTG